MINKNLHEIPRYQIGMDGYMEPSEYGDYFDVNDIFPLMDELEELRKWKKERGKEKSGFDTLPDDYETN